MNRKLFYFFKTKNVILIKPSRTTEGGSFNTKAVTSLCLKLVSAIFYEIFIFSPNKNP